MRRLVGVSERQLKSWESHGLLPAAEEYAFPDLLALQTLVKLKKDKVSSSRMAAAVRAIRAKLAGVKHPLKELRVVVEGRNIHVLVDGRKMDAVSGQLLLDFDQAELSRMLEFPGAKSEGQKKEEGRGGRGAGGKEGGGGGWRGGGSGG